MNAKLTELVFILDRSGSMNGLESDTIGGFHSMLKRQKEEGDNVQKHMPEAYKAEKVIFVITTDGLENSSEKYNYREIKRMIEEKKECGWEFLFLGANIDARKEAVEKAVQSESVENMVDSSWSEEIIKHRNKSLGRKKV